MTTLLENPIPIILFGLIAEAVLGIALVRTGRGALLWAMAGVLVLVLAGVGLEWLVVTEVEEVEATFDAVAEALVANDLQAVLAHICPSDTDTRGRVAWGMRLVEFTNAKITGLDVAVIHTTSPPTARAHVRGLVQFEGRSQVVVYKSYPLNIRFRLRKEPHGWVIIEHEWERNDPGR